MRARPLAASVLVLALALTGQLPATAVGTVVYQRPVPGQVLRAFDGPDHPYGAGHRGVDLAASAGTAVRSAAAGQVTFAGEVAGARWVTVAHADGVRTSYGHLALVHVRAGQDVVRGQLLGTATGANGDGALRAEPGLHWSARRGDAYLDPLSLLDRGLPRPTLVGPGGWGGTALVVDPYDPYPGGSRLGVLAVPSPDADRPGYARSPNHHHLVQLPGYGTAGPSPVLDPSYLGYGDGDHSTFSYRGCVPGPAGCAPRPYGGRDTDLTIDQAAELLDRHLRGQQRAQPGRPVDLLGHSMGGDVATHYLTHVYDPDDPELPPVGNLVTIATPHRGSGLGYLGRAVGDDALLGHQAEVVRRVAGAAGLAGADRVGFGSAPLQRYGGAFGADRPARDPERLAALGIGVLEIAGSRDLVVGRHDAGSVGAAVVRPGGHGSVTDVQATYEAVHDHLAGRPVTPVDPAVGWGSDEVADLARWTGLFVDVSPFVTLGRALAADDVARGLWEVGKALVGGPNRWQGRRDPREADLPVAPGLVEPYASAPPPS